MAYHPEVQHSVAQMAMEVEAMGPYLDRLADDWTNGVDHGMAWPLKIVAAKHRSVESAWKVADLALELAGGFGIFAASGMERLLRDARLGRIHPANPGARPRDRRQDEPGNQSGRAAALGIDSGARCPG